MELGQIICTPSNPNCSGCPVRIFCKAFERNSTREAPAKKLKKKFIDLKTTVMIVKYKDRFLLHSRADESKFLKGVDGFQIKTENATSGKVLGSFKHTITNHKLTNEVVLVTKGSRGVDEKGSWLPIETLAKSITTSFDKKAFAVLEKLCGYQTKQTLILLTGKNRRLPVFLVNAFSGTDKTIYNLMQTVGRICAKTTH